MSSFQTTLRDLASKSAGFILGIISHFSSSCNEFFDFLQKSIQGVFSPSARSQRGHFPLKSNILSRNARRVCIVFAPVSFDEYRLFCGGCYCDKACRMSCRSRFRGQRKCPGAQQGSLRRDAVSRFDPRSTIFYYYSILLLRFQCTTLKNAKSFPKYSASKPVVIAYLSAM